MSRAGLRAFAPASACPPQAMDLGLPSGRGFIALLEALRTTGGTAPGEIVARLLEDHQVGNAASLAKLIDEGEVFGFQWRACLWIPMFQFDADDLTLRAGVRQVRAVLPALWSGWAVAAWFAAANAELDGHSPADMLATELEAVLQAAHALDAVDEFVPYHARRDGGASMHA
jgi:hypothetical protein